MKKEHIEEKIIDKVRQTRGCRIRPHVLIRELSDTLAVSRTTIKHALAKQIERGKMTYSYRDPCSFVELVGNIES